ncbi:MAG TPA: carboxypeptidase regulatory-like domain-containing protein [Cyclobacteriaceae bacterium]|nr:carboxypeptidase regulatory-like domain-containing protein [Cyclobacteriaceae bacterium]
MKRILIISLILCSLAAAGQSTSASRVFQSPFRKAEILYQSLAYRSALTLYLHVADRDSTHQQATQRIAECYLHLDMVDEAATWYRKLSRETSPRPDNVYQYAQLLARQGKYQDAKLWYQRYVALAPSDTRTTEKLRFIDELSDYMQDSVRYKVTATTFNSDQSDFAPMYFKDGVVFVSARNHDVLVRSQSLSAHNDNEAMLNVFFAGPQMKQRKDVTLFYKRALNSPYHDGPVAFYKQGTQIVFSRNNLKGNKPVTKNGRINLELYFANLSGTGEISRMEAFGFNSDDYSIGHPWISDSGDTLFFASDMPGGIGGTDLYRSLKVDGKWDKPVNLGPTINTPGDEFYPFLANDSTFLFTSNGHGGFGGLDIFHSDPRHNSAPRNMGYPLNTMSDDFSLVLDSTGRKGIFASNRKGGEGFDDLYHVVIKSFSLEGAVHDRDSPTTIVPQATVWLLDSKGNRMDSVESDAQGRFNFVVEFDKDYVITASKEGYSAVDSVHYHTRNHGVGHVRLSIPLWRHNMFARGIVYSNETQKPLARATVFLENLTDGTKDSVVTDLTGHYDFLVKPNKQYHIRAIREGFLPQMIKMNTHGLFHGNLLNDFVLEEEFIDKVVIQFDYDQFAIRQDELPELDEVLKVLKRRPNSRIHIGAYADSKGTTEYNQRLSDNRAHAVLLWLEARGIRASRIQTTGFGETLLVNRCSDGVECPEEEHSKNRRAELKVQQD